MVYNSLLYLIFGGPNDPQFDLSTEGLFTLIPCSCCKSCHFLLGHVFTFRHNNASLTHLYVENLAACGWLVTTTLRCLWILSLTDIANLCADKFDIKFIVFSSAYLHKVELWFFLLGMVLEDKLALGMLIVTQVSLFLGSFSTQSWKYVYISIHIVFIYIHTNIYICVYMHI